MSQPSETSTSPPPAKSSEQQSIVLVSFPKIVFLYPSFIASLVAAIYMSFQEPTLDPVKHQGAVMTSFVFLLILAVNLVVLGFDFPRTTSITLFFVGAAIVLGLLLLFKISPDLIPSLEGLFQWFSPLANAMFYYMFAGMLGVIYVVVLVSVRFDYWEVRPNELLHHHGVLSNLERFSAPNLRIDKEINDVFEYLLLGSGRLILHPSNERRAIVLENVLFISKKEANITRMLGALQVQVRE